VLPPRPLPLPPLPVRARDLVVLLLLFFGGFLGGVFVIGQVLPSGSLEGLVPILALLAGQAAFMFFVTWLVVLRPHRIGLAEIGLRPTHPAWYRLAVAGGVLCVPLVSLVNLGFQSLLGGPIENPQLQALAPEGFSWTSLVAMLLLVGVFVPFVEEIVFRGLIFGWLRKHMGFVGAAVLSALLFSGLHGILALIPALAVMGLVLAAVNERSGSLWPCIILHGVFNSLMIITYYTVLAAGS